MIVVCAISLFTFGDEPTPQPNADGTIRAEFGSSEIVITTTNRLAGAIHSLKWNGMEFIDSHDHGRQLQSACSFDCATGKEFWAECFNPTEAGSRADGAGKTTTSKLLRFQAEGTELRTTNQMAFWLAPEEKSSGRPALNSTVLSEHQLTKRVAIGYKKLANIIEYETIFTVPKHERHHLGQFEALTGYMPREFNKFWSFRPGTGRLEELSDGPGEQEFPVVFSTEKGEYAMGVFSPDQPSKDYENAGYGRFRFPTEKVVKWNCVFRVKNKNGIASGEHRFRVFVSVGTLEDVRASLVAVVAEFRTR
jgi:hypothetical protein